MRLRAPWRRAKAATLSSVRTWRQRRQAERAARALLGRDRRWPRVLTVAVAALMFAVVLIATKGEQVANVTHHRRTPRSPGRCSGANPPAAWRGVITASSKSTIAATGTRPTCTRLTRLSRQTIQVLVTRVSSRLLGSVTRRGCPVRVGPQTDLSREFTAPRSPPGRDKPKEESGRARY